MGEVALILAYTYFAVIVSLVLYKLFGTISRLYARRISEKTFNNFKRLAGVSDRADYLSVSIDRMLSDGVFDEDEVNELAEIYLLSYINSSTAINLESVSNSTISVSTSSSAPILRIVGSTLKEDSTRRNVIARLKRDVIKGSNVNAVIWFIVESRFNWFGEDLAAKLCKIEVAQSPIVKATIHPSVARRLEGYDAN